ncbi:NAD(P)/FAD-dependent oxidoreductase [Methylomagnum ishizawai]|uniref:NAD(P)/FAD-dependent oxidoreductase n=1 Tax=Methylomagnum ishizawai TaxID=1760988 RepID=UPI001FEA552F|nr:TIGR03862 family flavoprotein [Methylomagnum ishizawai]
MMKFLPETRLAIVGGGPAGLMAAETAAGLGVSAELYDAMPSVGRKFLLAGKGGLNLTHAEPWDAFLGRYGARRAELEPLLAAFGPEDLRRWALGLGVATFVGSSGRVFPVGMKAAPLLRAWLHRLREGGVAFHMRHRWQGFEPDGGLRFATPEGPRTVRAEATILALGGGSWARLGSDGAWVPLLAQRGFRVAPLRPANCGFDVAWSGYFSGRHQGAAVKPVVVAHTGPDGVEQRRQGEFIVTATGIEGGLIYALSAAIRDTLAAGFPATLWLDLAPGRSLERLAAELSRPRGSLSTANWLKQRTGLGGVKAGLLREILPPETFADPDRLAAAIKALPLRPTAPRPLDEAISSAGGVDFGELDHRLMLKASPGLFCAGEMLDWEAPTGGYLLTASFATGKAAGAGAAAWLAGK